LRVDHGVSAEFAAVGPGSCFPVAVAECLSPASAPFFSSLTASVCPSLGTQRGGLLPLTSSTWPFPHWRCPPSPPSPPPSCLPLRAGVAAAISPPAHLEKPEPFSVEWQLPLATRA
jgi:hypothetical protein